MFYINDTTYTNFKDINGKKIYIGDEVWVIPKGTDLKMPGYVVFEDNIFQFKHRSDRVKPLLPLKDCQTIEVINALP